MNDDKNRKIANINDNADLSLNDEVSDEFYDNEEINYQNENNTKRSFGEKEHNRAKDNKGHYNRNYYAERQKALNEKVKQAENAKKQDWKMKEGHEG